MSDCQHHWLIETPHGSYSIGACRKCNEVRTFGNVLEDVVKDDLKAKSEAPERGQVAA